jgi:hypothetical protein
MPFFARPHYTSEATDFIESLKQADPTLEASQRQGRALLWVKTIDRAVRQDVEAGQVAQKPYPYQTSPTEH